MRWNSFWAGQGLRFVPCLIHTDFVSSIYRALRLKKRLESYGLFFPVGSLIKPSMWFGSKEVDAIERPIKFLHAVIEMSRNFKSDVAVIVEELLGPYKGDTELLTLGIGRVVWLASTASSLCCFELRVRKPFDRC